MKKNKSCFIIGLPNAGKTSFLAALAYSTQQNKVTNRLRWSQYSGNHQYMTRLATQWLELTPVSRTSLSEQYDCLQFEMVDIENSCYSITIPDLSGETFQQWYQERTISASHAEMICSCDGVLLFINPGSVVQPVLISNVPQDLRPDQSDNGLSQRNPSEDPTAVIYTELLQFVAYLRKNESCTVTVVISAWDILEKKYRTPREYIKTDLPLLWQYLSTNDGLFKTAFFGVSAQGDPLTDPERQERLAVEYDDAPAERIIVVDNSGNKGHDITEPLWYAMNE